MLIPGKLPFKPPLPCLCPAVASGQVQQPDGEHTAEILLVQPFDNVIHLEMTVPDALLEHRGNAVAATQQAFLVVALYGDISQPVSGDAQIGGIDRPEQPLLRAAVLK